MMAVNVVGELDPAILVVPYAWGLELLDETSIYGNFIATSGIKHNGIDLLYTRYILTNKKVVMKFIIRETDKVKFSTIHANEQPEDEFKIIKLAKCWAKFLFASKIKEDKKKCYFRVYKLNHYKNLKGKVAPLGPLHGDKLYESLNRNEFDKRWDIIERRINKYIENICFGKRYEWNWDSEATDDTIEKAIIPNKKKKSYLCSNCKKKRLFNESDNAVKEEVEKFLKKQRLIVSQNLSIPQYQPSSIPNENVEFETNISYPSQQFLHAVSENNLSDFPLDLSTTENTTEHQSPASPIFFSNPPNSPPEDISEYFNPNEGFGYSFYDAEIAIKPPEIPYMETQTKEIFKNEKKDEFFAPDFSTTEFQTSNESLTDTKSSLNPQVREYLNIDEMNELIQLDSDIANNFQNVFNE